MKTKILIGLGLFVLLLVWSAVSIYPDWLWFKNLDFSPVFWTMLLSRYGFGFIIWFLLILILSVNLAAARRLIRGMGAEGFGGSGAGPLAQAGISGNTLNYFILAFVLIASFVIASRGSEQWDMVLRFLYQQPFGREDPIFGKDIGFFVFTLPLLLYIRNGLMVLVLFAGLLTLAWYLKEGALQVEGEFAEQDGVPTSLPKIRVAEGAKRHILFLAGVMVLLMAVGYYLKTYGLLYSTGGAVYGAGYTDIHVKLWAYRILSVLSAGMALVVITAVFRPRKRLLWVSGAGWVALLFLLGMAIPFLVQNFVVRPNELEKEKPYIAYNIDFTRKAYNLDKIQEVPFRVSQDLTAAHLHEEEATIQNIRVWDERPLLRTYRQIQSIRLYYDFNDVDVDRYMIDGRYRQLMLSARELIVGQLPPQANTWVNRHLTYTHGYGLVSSPVNEVTREGLPELLVRDLPPAAHPDLAINRPEIYYGEKTDQYVLVKTRNQEFDYPKGDKNVYTSYQGGGGVAINSFLRRLLFAVQFTDPQILFTTYLSSESRIMFKRRIDLRAAAIAPFLDYDADPYLVISGGKLYWILDAYTTSDMYPYSRPTSLRTKRRLLNYIRNSVKVVIDAYQGTVRFYLADEEDPLVRTYARIFPDLFLPMKSMPEDLRRHIRYPKDFFQIQADAYRTYHMVNPQVFYNREDLWQVPDELYGDARQEMKAYYIIIKLPDADREEFLLMVPFTPSKKDNMIGWLAARNDLPHYGSLVVYKLPKEKLVYGPMQIEARVDQNTEISRDLTLWGQRGSRVIRGNLLAIPVRDSFIYVEPVYLEAKQSDEAQSPVAQSKGGGGLFRKQRTGPRTPGRKPPRKATASLPELKRVIVVFGNRLAMEQNLDRALAAVFGKHLPPLKKEPAGLASIAKGGQDPASMALEHYRRAKGFLREGKWAAYGKELEAMERILEKMTRTESR
ncbi:MAG: UPF0182 family protein [Deltaproteobacteria bacterium]|nr:UPF0182 family protein [Deltaproteobacteria bacterium]